MNVKCKVGRLCLGLLVAMAAPSSAATISFTFNSALLYAQPGSTVSFSGALTNTGAAPAFLNGDSVTFSAFTIDDTPFLLNFPPVVAPPGVVSGEVLRAMIPATAAFNTYAGTFSVLGGDTASAFNVLSTATFAVTVVPEPSSALLALGGLALLAIKKRRGSNRTNLEG